LEADIQGCFDNISHAWLQAHIPMDKRMLAMWLKAGFMDSHTLYPTEAGTPQGGIISPTLANMALDGLQDLLLKHFSSTCRQQNATLVHMVRYADDFIITGKSKELLENEVKPLVEVFLAERGLLLSPEKTKITPIHVGFDFLGFNVRYYGDKLLTKPSRKSIRSVLDKVRGIIKANATAKQVNLIHMLNPVLRGWANYHRHVVAKAIFNQVDSAVWVALWNWAKRRHPKQGARWIKAKYFKQFEHRNWVFAADEWDFKGGFRWAKLVKTCDTPIRRHVKIRHNTNPYDPAWDGYFTERISRKLKRRTG
jgi:RNA-directed DNA polymerase